MKEHRHDAALDQDVVATRGAQELDTRKRGGKHGLSSIDAGAYTGRRVRDLDGSQRETVADQALDGASSEVPYCDEMEARFGESFSDVRASRGGDAGAALADVGAAGVTRDSAIAFRDAEPSREVVAHELAHVVQARGAGEGPDRGAERGALAAEGQLAQDGPIHVGSASGVAGHAHFRDEDELPVASDWTFDWGAYQWKAESKPSRDEHEYDWSWGDCQVPDPFMTRDCRLARSHTPKDPDKQPFKSRNEHPSHHRREPDYSDIPTMHDFEREEFWAAISKDSDAVQSAHDEMGTNLEVFRHAEKDEQLRSLLYMLPKGEKEWSGDTAELTEAQSVPKKGGVTVGSLFDKDNDLVMSKHDQRAVDSTTKATQKGKGRTETVAGDTIKSDAALAESMKLVKGRMHEVEAAGELLKAELAVVEQLKYQDAADDAREEISQLKQEAENWKEGVGMLLNVGVTVGHLLMGNWADAADQVGTLAGTLIGHMNDGKFAAAERKLAGAEKKYTEARTKEVAHRVNVARATLNKSLADLNAAKDAVLQALTDRRNAYNSLGTTAASEIDCPEGSQHRIAGMLSAIPLVEVCIARARSIKQAAKVPAYTSKSGKGFAMARYHQDGNTGDFLWAVAELNWAYNTFSQEERKWDERLTQLLVVKEKIIGPRPGG
jgi:hypothetical protein